MYIAWNDQEESDILKLFYTWQRANIITCSSKKRLKNRSLQQIILDNSDINLNTSKIPEYERQNFLNIKTFSQFYTHLSIYYETNIDYDDDPDAIKLYDTVCEDGWIFFFKHYKYFSCNLHHFDIVFPLLLSLNDYKNRVITPEFKLLIRQSKEIHLPKNTYVVYEDLGGFQIEKVKIPAEKYYYLVLNKAKIDEIEQRYYMFGHRLSEMWHHMERIEDYDYLFSIQDIIKPYIAYYEKLTIIGNCELADYCENVLFQLFNLMQCVILFERGGDFSAPRYSAVRPARNEEI